MGIAPATLERWVLRSYQEDGAVLPAFPVVASRLVDALEQPDVAVEDVREIIAQDPAITSHVIRTANSAFYGSCSPIEDVRGAIMRLGFREIASAAMSAACRSLFTLEDRAEFELFTGVWDRLWASSLVGAYGARLIASELKLGDPGQIFLSAIFRDVGSLLILKLVASGLVHGRLGDKPTDEQLARAFAHLHEQLGAAYLSESQLPGYAVQVAERHHHADLPFAHDTLGLHVVRVADGLCDRLGIPPFTTLELGAAGEQSAELLGLDEDRLEYFELQIDGVREQLSNLL